MALATHALLYSAPRCSYQLSGGSFQRVGSHTLTVKAAPPTDYSIHNRNTSTVLVSTMVYVNFTGGSGLNLSYSGDAVKAVNSSGSCAAEPSGGTVEIIDLSGADQGQGVNYSSAALNWTETGSFQLCYRVAGGEYAPVGKPVLVKHLSELHALLVLSGSFDSFRALHPGQPTMGQPTMACSPFLGAVANKLQVLCAHVSVVSAVSGSIVVVMTVQFDEGKHQDSKVLLSKGIATGGTVAGYEVARAEWHSSLDYIVARGKLAAGA